MNIEETRQGASASVLAQKYFSLLVILRERNDRRISYRSEWDSLLCSEWRNQSN